MVEMEKKIVYNKEEGKKRDEKIKKGINNFYNINNITYDSYSKYFYVFNY